MQIAKTTPGHFGHAGAESPPFAHRFRTLLFLSGWKAVDSDSIRTRLGLSEEKFLSLIDHLQRSYLVDVVSEMSGGFVVEYLRLTERGNSELHRMLESMCELPDL